jgi:hypothetical protein
MYFALQNENGISCLTIIVMLHIWGFLRYATILDGLAWLVDNNVNKQHCYARNNKTHITMVFKLIRIEQSGLEISRTQTCLYVGRDEHVSLCGGQWRHSIVWAGKWQVNDGLYAEVPLWCESGPIARRWIVPTCVWKLSDCKNGSECWKIATRGPVGRIL